MKKKTVLLTGATGYLGSHLLEFWISKGHEVVILKRSTSSLQRIEKLKGQYISYDVDQDNLEKVFESEKIEIVIHVAATYGRKSESLSEIVDSNTLFPARLLDLSIKYGIKYFINTATSLPREINTYSLSKSLFQDLLNFKKDDIISINLVLEYFYGPGDENWKFINMVFDKLLKNEYSIDFTNGEQKRDFIYISDVVSAFDTVLNNVETLKSCTIISVGTGKAYSLKAVVELCQKVLNNSFTRLNFGILPNRDMEIEEMVADTFKLESLGWKCEYSLEDGINNLNNLKS